MKKIEADEITIPAYAIQKNGIIAGFFGNFRFLSNFYIAEAGVSLNGLYFPSVEHAYQASKWDPIDQYSFINLSVGEAKKKGQLGPHAKSKKWHKHKYELMESLVRQKFTNNFDLNKMLLLTDGYHLEERNHWGDTDWGTNERGEGENNLGKILMKIREELKQKNKSLKKIFSKLEN